MNENPAARHCPDCAVRMHCAIGQLSEEASIALLPRIRARVFHRGDRLIDESRPSEYLRIVKLGTVIAYREGLDGRSRPIGVISRGMALGLFGAFALPSQVSCIALSRVRVCEISVANLHEMGASGSGLLVYLMKGLALSFAGLAAWSEAMRLPGVVNQLAYVALLLADASRSSVIELPSHAVMGELLGSRRETVARAVGKLEREGGLERQERKRWVVAREPLLQRLAQASA